jgi:hypothetical protein
VTDPLERRQEEILRHDAERRLAQDAEDDAVVVDLTGLPAEQAYKLGRMTVGLMQDEQKRGLLSAVAWLRSPEVLRLLEVHFRKVLVWGCSCGAKEYKSHAAHLQQVLARALESATDEGPER